jgi:hypothetical protein
VPSYEQAEALALGEIVRQAVQVTTDLSSIGIVTGPEKRVTKKKGKR